MATCTEQDFEKFADYGWLTERFGEIFADVVEEVNAAQEDLLELNVLSAWFMHSLRDVEGLRLSDGAALGLTITVMTAYLLGRQRQTGRVDGAGDGEVPEVFREFLTDLFAEADDAGGD